MEACFSPSHQTSQDGEVRIRIELVVIVEAKIAPRNSLLFIAGTINDFETPDVTGLGLVWHTRTCVAVGTLMEYDGETSVVLSNEPQTDSVTRDFWRVFDGSIDTSAKEIWLSTVNCEGVISLPVIWTTSGVEIWANDQNEPDKILIIAKP
jgi:hypothetical protein